MPMDTSDGRRVQKRNAATSGTLSRYFVAASIGAGLTACGCGVGASDSGDALAERCSPDRPALMDAPWEPYCQPEPCADECGSVDGAVQCCVDRYGRGVADPTWDGISYLDDPKDGCGPEVYAPVEFLSPRAAVCVAQVHGMSSGIWSCDVELSCSVTGVIGPSYLVTNTTEDPCSLQVPGEGAGESVLLDALSGVVQASGPTYYSMPDCLPREETAE